MASEDGDSASVGDDDGHQTIDLSTKPRESLEVTTTVCCTSPVNNNTINNNNNSYYNINVDGDKIVKGSAKRKKPNPMQIVLAKKSKIQEEIEDVCNVDDTVAVTVDDDCKENIDETTMTAANATTTVSTTSTEDEPVPVTVNRKNSIKSTEVKSEQEKLDECMTEEILRSVLTDESDGDMITEAFVKKKGVTKKSKKGRKDRKNGGNKKEMTGE